MTGMKRVTITLAASLVLLSGISVAVASKPVWAPRSLMAPPVTKEESRKQVREPLRIPIAQDTVYIDALKYRRFKVSGFAIVVPDSWRLSADDFQNAYCASRIVDGKPHDMTVSRTEPSHAEQELHSFAELARQTISEKCGIPVAQLRR